MKKVIVYKKLTEELKQQMEKECDVLYFENESPGSLLKNDTFLEALNEVEGIIGVGLKVDEAFLSYTPNLKIVSNVIVGYDNFDVPAMTKHQVMATNTPDVLTDTTADTIFGLLLATARRIPELHQHVKDLKWKGKIGPDKYGVDVHHKTLGIIGMGRIGTAIAKRAHLGFDMDILYYNRSRNEEAEELYKAKYCELTELLQASDYVCVMPPLTAETKDLIGDNELKQMKKSAILIVGSRGGIVQEDALYEALTNGTILAAGLDVFAVEPIEDSNPLLQLDNVVLLPHVGSATSETRQKMDELAVENLLKGLRGERPTAIINPEVLEN